MTNHSCRTCRKYKENMWCVKCNYEPMVQADVVEVVRCKDCIYGEIDDNDFPTQYLCHHHGDVRRTRESDYCSYGERAEE